MRINPHNHSNGSAKGHTENKKKNNKENIYHLNLGVPDFLLNNAHYEINKYRSFIKQAMSFLKGQAHSIRIERKEVLENGSGLSEGVVLRGTGETEIKKERRYRLHFAEPANKKEEAALSILFSDHTQWIYAKRDFRPEKQIPIYDKNEDENYIELTCEISGEEIYLQPDTYQLKKQLKALSRLLEEPLPEHLPLLRLFSQSDDFECDWYNKKIKVDWKILTEDERKGIEEQREFVIKALLTEDFAFMEGPPGSGKTTVIIELIAQLVAKGMRVLLCSATHAAIDNVLERITGRYQNILGELVVPVRISRSTQSVKENVRPYLLQGLGRGYREKLLNFLRQNQQYESQKYLLEALQSGKGETWIQQLILESANLVCGTMIGILQYPDIKAGKTEVPFDVMIVDEASKVTFPDFLVPALYAKKWITVGDIKQLPPYVEEDYINDYLNTLIPEEEQKRILERFNLKKVFSNKASHGALKIYFTEGVVSKERENIKEELERLSNEHRSIKEFMNREPQIIEIDETDLPDLIHSSSTYELNGADLLICKKSDRVKVFLSRSIFVKSILINDDLTEYPAFRYRQSYLWGDKGESGIEYPLQEQSWGDMVTSRLIQSFGFRDVEHIFVRVRHELEYLLPGKLWERVDEEIKRVAFHSILEIFQRGTGRQKNQSRDRVITDGFRGKQKEARLVSLSYQHRMHPEIAALPSKHFYGGNNLLSDHSVYNRPWQDPWSGPRVLWISYPATSYEKADRITNKKEVELMKRHLEKFLNWAKDNPRPDGKPYELAILTFYRDQERELRKMVREVTGQKRYFARFRSCNTEIFLYTVDKFQGQEADVVFLGFTKHSSYAHYNSPNRLNVALTRARHRLLLFGDREWFDRNARLEALKELTKREKIIAY